MSDLLEHLERPADLVHHQVVKEVKFNLEHKSKLAEVERAINPDVVPVTDSAADPVLLSAETSERCVDIAQTGSVEFNKIVTVLAALCDEMAFLTSTAEAKFFAPFALFGHSKVAFVLPRNVLHCLYHTSSDTFFYCVLLMHNRTPKQRTSISALTRTQTFAQLRMLLVG
jgi:hypothetical protein